MDLYFTPAYGKLYETHENATLHQVTFENEYGKVWYVFLMRKVPYEVGDRTYYDIITPYGFGGPVIVETTDEDRLLNGFYTHFHDYCLENNIVAEFVRFHPLENVKERENFPGDVVNVGRQIIRNLKQSMNKNISKSVRYNYRKALENGVTVEFDSIGEKMDKFLELYYETMNRNEAEEYYYFSPQFFERLNRTLKGHFVYIHVKVKGRVVASGLALYGKDYAYAFLGGATEEGYRYKANECIEMATMKWLKEKEISYYLMGGGYNGEDGIYNFKKKFAKDSDYDYHIGKKIHQQDIYGALIQKRLENGKEITDNGFFPAYRAPLIEKAVVN